MYGSDQQFMADYIGACLKFCIIPTLLPAYMAICAVPKEKVDCSIIKNSTASKVFGQKNKRAQDFVEISHHVGQKLIFQFFYVIKWCLQ